MKASKSPFSGDLGANLSLLNHQDLCHKRIRFIDSITFPGGEYQVNTRRSLLPIEIFAVPL